MASYISLLKTQKPGKPFMIVHLEMSTLTDQIIARRQAYNPQPSRPLNHSNHG